MPRPGAVNRGRSNTPPVLFHFGEGIRLEKMPLALRIVYRPTRRTDRRTPASPSSARSPNRWRTIRSSRRLRRGMKLTIAFDICPWPLPPMAAPDVRQPRDEEVIDMAAEPASTTCTSSRRLGLHREMTEDELRHIVGERIFANVSSRPPYQHDGEDPENTSTSADGADEEVTLNRRCGGIGLVIYVNLTLVPMDGGTSRCHRAASFRSIRPITTPNASCVAVVHDPPDSALHHS